MRISKSPFSPEELKSEILRGYCGDQLSLKMLFKLNRLGLWPSSPIRRRVQIQGQSPKEEVKVVLQED